MFGNHFRGHELSGYYSIVSYYPSVFGYHINCNGSDIFIYLGLNALPTSDCHPDNVTVLITVEQVPRHLFLFYPPPPACDQ